MWGNWGRETIESLCLSLCSSYNLTILHRYINVSARTGFWPELFFFFFFFLGREGSDAQVHTGSQCKSSSFYPGSHIGTWTAEPSFLHSELKQGTGTHSFGQGVREPFYSFLVLLLFLRGQLQFLCGARLFKLNNWYPHVSVS